MKNREESPEERRTRRQGIIVMSVALAAMLVILIIIGIQLMKVASDPETLEAWLEGWGVWGVFIFMILVILQILAAIVPGGPFEVAAGYLYGPLMGAVICDVAMTAGSVLVFLLVRKIGMKFVRMFFSQEDIDSVKWLQTSDKKNLVLFIVFLIPGMPKDLISYVVGLTDIKIGTWVFITAVGRFPAILLSTISGSALENNNYTLFIVVMAILAVAMVVGGIAYKKHTGSSQ